MLADERAESGPIVDVHCHIFNADDVPVRGFLEHLQFGTSELAHLLATLVETVLRGAAPGYGSDLSRIRQLLTGERWVLPQLDTRLAESIPVGAAPTELGRLDEKTEVALADLAAVDPVFVNRLAVALQRELQPGRAEISAAGAGEVYQGVVRAVRWALLFGLSRLDLAAGFVSDFSDQVDLACPLLVDLGMGLGEQPATSAWERVELLEGISVLSMKGLLPGGGKARLHPFIGFDPRRQMQAILAGVGATPLEIVQSAVLQHGFIGVKVYPSMGWRPLGNSAGDDMTAREAGLVDSQLRRFYSWCEECEVPITTHANSTNATDPAGNDFAGPDGWAAVLQEFPNLHLDFAHFGGAWPNPADSTWPAAFARLAVAHDHVYADVADHRIYDPAVLEGYFRWLLGLFADPATVTMRDRLMFGSDWFMLALHPEYERFLATYRERYLEAFGAAATARFLGGNALRFLGFDSPSNANAVRLRKRYQAHAPGRLPSWLAAVE